jgi:hypothetical protein
VATLWRFESSFGHQHHKRDRFGDPFFHFRFCPKSKAPARLAWGLEWFGLQAEPGSRNVTESSFGHQHHKGSLRRSLFHSRFSRKARRLRALREDSKGSACKPNRGRGTWPSPIPGNSHTRVAQATLRYNALAAATQPTKTNSIRIAGHTTSPPYASRPTDSPALSHHNPQTADGSTDWSPDTQRGSPA